MAMVLGLSLTQIPESFGLNGYLIHTLIFFSLGGDFLAPFLLPPCFSRNFPFYPKGFGGSARI